MSDLLVVLRCSRAKNGSDRRQQLQSAFDADQCAGVDADRPSGAAGASAGGFHRLPDLPAWPSQLEDQLRRIAGTLRSAKPLAHLLRAHPQTRATFIRTHDSPPVVVPNSCCR